MAGTTTSFPFKPLLSRTLTPPLPFTLSSLESSINGVRLRNLNFLKFDSTRSIHVTSLNSFTARFGGYRPKPSSSSRRKKDFREEEFDDDDASLDMSTVRSVTVRLIDAEQNMLGIVSKSEAIKMAEEAELDLVILSPDADPPVLRIMDYSKYRYEQQKRKREQMKRSAATRMDIKELKMGYNIDIHDYSVRLKAAMKFLKEGDKVVEKLSQMVKMVINLKGREKEFRNTAIELMKRFQNDIGELATEEAKSFKDRNVFIVLVPNKAILTKAQEQQKKKEKPDVTETSTEISADTLTDISAETSADTLTDISAENSAKSDISQEISAETSSDTLTDISAETSAESDISQEISAETSAESDITQEISAESGISQEISVESDISQEISAESGISQEISLESDISQEISAESDISAQTLADFDSSAETSAEISAGI